MKSFDQAFLEMHETQQAPDVDACAEHEFPIDRYIGKGPEHFNYSIRLIQSCSSLEFDKAIQRELALAKKRGRTNLEWKSFAIPKLNFVDAALKNHGFSLNRESRLMYMDSKFRLGNADSVTVQAVQTDADFEKLIEANTKAFSEPTEWLRKTLYREIFLTPSKVKAFISFVDGKIASSAWIKIYGSIGFLFGGGTVPELRRHGAYKALVSARCAFAQSQGVPFVMSECSPDSERVLRALQFHDAGHAYQWVYSFS